MNYEYPIELLAKSSRTRFQAGFAKMSTFLLPDIDGVMLEPTSEGLRILAVSERALERSLMLLRDIHGDDLELGRARARLLYGDDVREPVMSMRLTVAAEHVDTVLSDLSRRGALVQIADRRTSPCVLRAQVRLAVLLGYEKDLAAMTSGTAAHWIQLSHYEAIAQHSGIRRSRA
jgi:predicted membrane GTPase involved in stress response